jgi:hypothetical protein
MSREPEEISGPWPLRKMSRRPGTGYCNEPGNYNPELPTPTVTPTYAPQNPHADFGGANTEIHGMFFSGRHAQSNPLSVDGTGEAAARSRSFRHCAGRTPRSGHVLTG